MMTLTILLFPACVIVWFCLLGVLGLKVALGDPIKEKEKEKGEN